MHTGIDLVLGSDAFNECPVADTAFIKRYALGDSFAVAINEIIENYDSFAAVGEILDRYASDIAGSAGH
jgi:hypothetical protein